MVMYGRGTTNDSVFLQRAISFIGEVPRDDCLESIFERLVVPSTGRVHFSKALNRSVIGSMNDLVNIAKSLLIVDQLSLYDTSFHLDKVPMSLLKYEHPRDAFMKLGLMVIGASNDENNAII